MFKYLSPSNIIYVIRSLIIQIHVNFKPLQNLLWFDNSLYNIGSAIILTLLETLKLVPDPHD